MHKFTHLYDNNEITGKIYVQTQALFLDAVLGFSKGDKDLFFEYILAVMHKLHATRYHLGNYEMFEKMEYEEVSTRDIDETRECLELISEVEAFLFQVKSSLDMLVKLLDAVLGKGIVRTQTYIKYGEKLIKGLEQYKQSNGANKKAVDALIYLITADKEDWIKTTIGWRNELNHIKGLRGYVFKKVIDSDGKIVIEKPTFKNKEVLPLLRTIYENNLNYHQDFIAYVVMLKLPSAFNLIPADKSKAVQEFGDLGEFVKWNLGFNAPN